MDLGVQVMSDKIIYATVMSDFEIKINIAVYSANGAFIKQCDASTFSAFSIMSIRDDIEKELKERG